jgi:hypothetical protein
VSTNGGGNGGSVCGKARGGEVSSFIGARVLWRGSRKSSHSGLRHGARAVRAATANSGLWAVRRANGQGRCGRPTHAGAMCGADPGPTVPRTGAPRGRGRTNSHRPASVCAYGGVRPWSRQDRARHRACPRSRMFQCQKIWGSLVQENFSRNF